MRLLLVEDESEMAASFAIEEADAPRSYPSMCSNRAVPV